MIDTILLDIDGVCNTFQHHVFNCLDLPYSDDSWYPTACGWDIVAAANVLADYKRFTPTSFWKSITRKMWAYAPPSPEFDPILVWSSDAVGKENVHFLSSPTLSPDSLAGKLEWIQQYAPSWMQRQFLIGPSKNLCANPKTLLIDDSDKNVAAFREAGGYAILVPRPWNHLHGRNALNYLDGIFPTFFGEQ